MNIQPWMKGLGSLLPWALLAIMLFDKVIIPLYINWKKDKRFTLKTQKLQVSPVANNPGHSPGVKPGDGTTCKKNSENIAKLETSVGNIEDDIKEVKKNNRDDHKDMFNKIDKLRNNRR